MERGVLGVVALDARIAEEAADWVLPVEGLDGPAVGAGGGGGGGCEDGGRGGDGDEAAPDTEVGGGRHAATVGPALNRPLTRD
jgi:hypothetical protein